MNEQAKYKELSQLLQVNQELKHRFLSSPKSILAEMNIEVPDSISIKVHEDTPKVKNFVIPFESVIEDDNTASNPLLRAAIAKMNTDENFKSRLINNPKIALSELTGESLPEELNIVVHENTPTLKHLVICVDSINEELSEKELETIAGGIRIPGVMVAGLVMNPKPTGSKW